MGTIFRKTVTRPLPVGCEIITRKGKQLAQWTNRKGKTVTAELNEAGDRIRTEAGTYLAKYRDGSGIVCEVSTGCRDKASAANVLADLEKQAELVRSKILTSDQSKIADHADTLLDSHIADFIQYQRDREISADWIKTTDTYLRSDANGCGWRYLRDLSSDKLQRWLSSIVMSARVHNVHVQSWITFGNWLAGKRSTGSTGAMRILSNPFIGMGKRSEKSDRKRKARALTETELTALLDAAKRRPLEDALEIRRGPRKGELGAKVSDDRRIELERLGTQRALIYKTLILTGLRLNELRTLTVGCLSFGDVPFIRMDASNEKNRKGSTLPLRSDLAAELKEWTKGKPNASKAFTVPAGLLRIMDRDLIAAGIPKRDADGTVVHVHALRHSFGTHLSKSGVAPRTAQGLMRHSKIELTMNTYTDSRLLDSAGAIESLGLLRTVAPTVAPATAQTSQILSNSDNLEVTERLDAKTKKPHNSLGITGFVEVEDRRLELLTSCMPCNEHNEFDPTKTRKIEPTAEALHQWLHQDSISRAIVSELPNLSEADRAFILALVRRAQGRPLFVEEDSATRNT